MSRRLKHKDLKKNKKKKLKTKRDFLFLFDHMTKTKLLGSLFFFKLL